MIRLQLNQFAPMRVAWNFMEILRKLNFDRWRCRSWTAFSSQMPFAPGISGKFCCATPQRIKLRDSCCRSRWLYEDIYIYILIHTHTCRTDPYRAIPYNWIALRCTALQCNTLHCILCVNACKNEQIKPRAAQAFMLLSSALVEYAEPAFDSAKIHHGTLGLEFATCTQDAVGCKFGSPGAG